MVAEVAQLFDKTRQWYEEQINRVWRRTTEAAKNTVAGWIETGKLIADAKETLTQHGEFLPMLESGSLPFSPRTAQRLMAIAGNSVIANTTHVSHLPPAWGTLYELVALKLAPKELEARIADGTIHSGMQRKDVLALKPPPSPEQLEARRRRREAAEQREREKASREAEHRKELMGVVEACVMSISHLVFDTAHELTEEERPRLYQAAHQVIDDVKAQIEREG